MATTLPDLKRAFYIQALDIPPAEAETLTISDLELAYFRSPPQGGSGGTGGIPDDGSVTNVKVATNAAINLDKTADSSTRATVTPAERSKLQGVATGATANAPDSTKASVDGNGRISMAMMPAGSEFTISSNGSGGWTYQGTNCTSRPSGLAHLRMIAYGGTVAPSFVSAGDIWFPEAS